MGMDVYGRDPENDKGEYFRNNVWWWHPLWMYVEETFPEIAKLVPNAHSNDGDGLGKKNSIMLAKKIKANIKSGQVKQYAKEYTEAIEALPMEDCEYCSTTGKRTWEANSANNLTDQPIQKECNGCNGIGKRKSFDASYPFSEDNVIEFAEFLLYSGGFRIC